MGNTRRRGGCIAGFRSPAGSLRTSFARAARRCRRCRGCRARNTAVPRVCGHSRCPRAGRPGWTYPQGQRGIRRVGPVRRVGLSGGPRGARTHNPRIKSPLLCQLELEARQLLDQPTQHTRSRSRASLLPAETRRVHPLVDSCGTGDWSIDGLSAGHGRRSDSHNGCIAPQRRSRPRKPRRCRRAGAIGR